MEKTPHVHSQFFEGRKSFTNRYRDGVMIEYPESMDWSETDSKT